MVLPLAGEGFPVLLGRETLRESTVTGVKTSELWAEQRGEASVPVQ